MDSCSINRLCRRKADWSDLFRCSTKIEAMIVKLFSERSRSVTDNWPSIDLILRYLLQDHPLPENLVVCRFSRFLFASASAPTPGGSRDAHRDLWGRGPKTQSRQRAVDLRWRLAVEWSRFSWSIFILLESSTRVRKSADAFCRGNVLGY